MKLHQKLSLFLILLLSLSVFASFGQSRTEERVKRIYTDRDTYINSYSTDSNYGGQAYLCIGEMILGFDHTFLHFDLSEAPEEFTQISLSLDFYWITETMDVSLYTTSSTWNELSLTWINAPSEGSLVGNYVDFAEENIYLFGITTFMESWHLDEISFIVKEFDYSETGYIQLSSREGAYTNTDKPHLRFYYEVEIPDINLIPIISIIVGVGITIGIVVYLIKKKKTREIQEDLQKKRPSPYSIPDTFCSNCGAKIQAGSFCTNCGKKQI